MSYIRAGSNPEKLYIWGGHNGTYLSTGLRPQLQMFIPGNLFHQLLEKYHSEDYDFVSEEDVLKHAGITVQGEWVKGEHKIVLRYSDWNIPMYYSTWYYLSEANKYRFN